VAGPAAQVVAHPAQARRAGHAAEAEDGHTLEVGPQAEPVDQARVERRRAHPGHGREEQAVELARAQAGGVERGREGRRAHLEPHLAKSPVRCGEVEAEVVLHWEREVAAADLHRLVQLRDPARVVVAGGPDRLESSDELILLIAVGRERGAGAEHTSSRRRGVHRGS
jgi:hypothetical protein